MFLFIETLDYILIDQSTINCEFFLFFTFQITPKTLYGAIMQHSCVVKRFFGNKSISFVDKNTFCFYYKIPVRFFVVITMAAIEISVLMSCLWLCVAFLKGFIKSEDFSCNPRSL